MKKLKFGKDQLLALTCALLWGANVPFFKTAYNWLHVPAGNVPTLMMFAGVRWTIAGLLSLAILSTKEKKLILPSGKTNWLHSGIYGLLQTALLYTVYFTGLSYTLGVRSSVISASAAFMVLIISALVFKEEKFTALKLIGCIVGFGGIAYMNLSGTDSTIPLSFRGEGMILFSQVLFGFSSVLLKRYSRTEDPLVLSTWQMLIGGVLLIAAAVPMGGRLYADEPWQWSVMLLISSTAAVCMNLWATLMSRNEPYTISVYKFAEPIFGVLLSAVILSEGSTLNVGKCIVALIMVTAGIIVTNLPQGKKE